MKPVLSILFAFTVLNKISTFSQVTCSEIVPVDYSGKCISYHPNGAISLTGKYKKGKKHGVFEGRYPTGEIQMKARFDHDEPVNEILTYYKNGVVSSRAIYNEKQGQLKTYHSNGILKAEGRFTDEGLTGIWYTYNEKGEFEDSTDFNSKSSRELIELYEIEATEFDVYNGDLVLKNRVDAIYSADRNEMDRTDVFSGIPEYDATFPGGNEALSQFILSNVWYPEEASDKGFQGVVYISFIVEPDGSLTHIYVKNGVHELLDKEAIRLILIMPNWLPAMDKGTNVRTACQLPIRFKLD